MKLTGKSKLALTVVGGMQLLKLIPGFLGGLCFSHWSLKLIDNRKPDNSPRLPVTLLPCQNVLHEGFLSLLFHRPLDLSCDNVPHFVFLQQCLTIPFPNGIVSLAQLVDTVATPVPSPFFRCNRSVDRAHNLLFLVALANGLQKQRAMSMANLLKRTTKGVTANQPGPNLLNYDRYAYSRLVYDVHVCPLYP